MVNTFLIYDIAFLVLFTLGVVLFLYTRRKNLQRQGLLYLYRTKVGIKFIDWTSSKFARILKPMQYIVVASGYILMGSMIWFLLKFSWFYITSPTAARLLKVPVIVPLVPYLPEIFNIDFLPQFPFTFWIIIIAIIAIPHEFAHGIFARLNKFKVHATGFGFLGPFLAAFVEPDEKQMFKAKKFPQLSVLAAGTFANVIFTIIFALILWGFFSLTFVPAGVHFNAYSTGVINTSEAIIPDDFSLDDEFIEIEVDNKKYYTDPLTLEQTIEEGRPQIIVYEDSPAFRARLHGAISEIDGKKITSFEELSGAIQSYSPGDEITIKTLVKENVRDNDPEIKEFNVELADKNGKAFLGIGIRPIAREGLLGSFFGFVSTIKDPFIFYESSIGTLGVFIYDLLWWIVLISISVALVNMLPVGIFDGGRFFFLTMWGLTGSKKFGENAFKASTWFILLLIAALLIKWVLAFT